MFQVYGSLWVSETIILKPEIVILDSLLRQLDGFEFFNMLSSCKILLKFTICFKISEFFCPFLSLTSFLAKEAFQVLQTD